MCYMSKDFREGLDAFLTKRTPNWTGTMSEGVPTLPLDGAVATIQLNRPSVHNRMEPEDLTELRRLLVAGGGGAGAARRCC